MVEGSLQGAPKAKRAGRLKILSAVLRDTSGQLPVTWFNMMFLQKTLRMGTRYILRGRAVKRNGILQLQQPKILTEQEYHRQLNQLQPVYRLTAGLTNRTVAKTVQTALNETELNGDFIPLEIRRENHLMNHKKQSMPFIFLRTARNILKQGAVWFLKSSFCLRLLCSR